MIKDDQVTLDLSIQKRFHSKNYQLIKMIGQGGFGIVYKARQISTDQIVAIKFLTLSSEFDTHKRERYLERFQRETALSSRLQHPNIVRLLDKGVCDDDLVYAVFEYVDGKSLKQHLSEKGALLPVDTANLMGQVLDALSHAHDQGVIHRDLKPANIMLSSVGTKDHIKILDFGIGTLSNEVRQHDYKSITLTHETLGTPSYSAPEQLRGESPSIKSDIYVWGLVFIECLTGEPAITGNSLASIFHKQLSLSNVPIPTAVAGHPVANLLRRVLNKKMNERAGDASLIYHDLKQININSLVGDLSLKQKSATPTYLDNSDNYSKAFISSLNNLDKKVIDQSPNNAADMSSLGLQETQINTGLAINTGMIERKQISILCVTLTLKSITESMGSSDEECDLELLDVLHRDSKSQCIDIAVRYGAFHAGTLGDTLLFYFGYPAVSDNDSRLCARTALDITSNINQRNALLISSHNLEIEARMGMHAGMVSHYPDAMPEGGAINIAMELSRLSRAKQVLCSQASKRLLEGYIEFKMALNHTLGIQKGPETVHQLIGERLNEAFGFLRGTRSAHAFVGREEELEKLTNVFNDLSDNRPSYVHIHGEAGIGKSRLIYEVRGIASNFQQYMCQCLPEHKYSGLYPILTIVKNKFDLNNFSVESDINAFINKILAVIESSKIIDEKKSLPLLLIWLNLPIPNTMSLSVLSADAQKKILFDLLVILLIENTSEYESNKTLLLFEDMHWSDPTSLEFLEYMYNNQSYIESKSMVISTSREIVPRNISKTCGENIHITGFDNYKIKLFIKELFSKNNISEEVNLAITKRTDGIPLFIEELVSMMINRGVVHHLNGVVDFVRDDSINSIPDSLLESLQQKIDRLNQSKETAQIAAVIGREFDAEILINVSSKNLSEIQIDLIDLISKELIYKQRMVDGDVYIFKHALVRDAVYGFMDSTMKIRAHSKIAGYLINDPAKKLNYEKISYHYSLSKNFVEAIKFGLLSSERYLERFMVNEAVNQCLLVDSWLDSSEGDNVEYFLENNRVYIQALMLKLGWGHNEVYERIKLSYEIFNKLKPEQFSYKVLLSLASCFSYYYVGGNKKQIIKLDSLFKKIQEKNTSIHLNLVMSVMQGFMAYNQGNAKESEKLFERAVNIYGKHNMVGSVSFFGIDILVWSKSMLAILYWNKGELDKSKRSSKEAIRWSEDINHIPSVCIALLYCSIIFQYSNDRKNANAFTERLIYIAKKYEFPAYVGYANLIRLWSIKELDIEKYEYEINNLKHISCNTTMSYYAALSVEALIENKDYVNAEKKIKECLAYCEEYGEYIYESELYRKLANCLSLNNECEEVLEFHYKKSMFLSKDRNLISMFKKSNLDYLKFKNKINY